MPKKSKKTGLSDSAIDLIIVVVGVFVLFAIFAVYLGAGFYLNSQITQLYAENKCLEVAQYSYFPSLYPKGLFGSILHSHDQYGECKAVIDVGQAVNQKNWPFALTRARDYLAAYPNGAYAASMNDHVINTLSTWSQELIARGDYGGGIDKLKQLADGYPNSPAALSALDSMLQIYLAWAKELLSKNNYAEAEKSLRSAYNYFPKDSPRSEQIKQKLVSVYVEWGNAAVQAGDMENGTKRYAQAGELAPEINAELLIARAQLDKAVELAQKGSFDRALDKVEDVLNKAAADDIKAEADTAKAKIYIEYSQSSLPQVQTEMAVAMKTICDGGRPVLPIYGLNADTIRFGLVSPFPVNVSSDWTATNPGELHYVACATEQVEKVQTCLYDGGYRIYRNRYNWKMVAYDVLTGEKIGSTTLYGGDPPNCKGYDYFSPGVNKELAGARPSADAIIKWFQKLNVVQ